MSVAIYIKALVCSITLVFLLLSQHGFAQGSTPDPEVERAHPGYVQIVLSQEFQDWFSTQPNSVKHLAGSNNPTDAIAVLDLYKSFLRKQVQTQIEISKSNEQSRASPEPKAKTEPTPASSPKVSKSDINKETDLETLFKRVSPSVLTITTPDSQGSGVVVLTQRAGESMRSTIATNAHVVGQHKRVQVLHGDKTFKGIVVYRNEEIDFALVSSEELSGGKPATLQDRTLPPIGSRVIAIGSPRGLSNSLTTGIVSGHRSRAGVKIVQTDAAISPGSSGGGLFNYSGELVGITTAKVRDSEGLNLAISTIQIVDIIDARQAQSALNFIFDPDMNKGYAGRYLTAALSGNIIDWLRLAKDPQSGETRTKHVMRVLLAFGDVKNEQQLAVWQRDVGKLLSAMESEMPMYPKK